MDPTIVTARGTPPKYFSGMAIPNKTSVETPSMAPSTRRRLRNCRLIWAMRSPSTCHADQNFSARASGHPETRRSSVSARHLLEVCDAGITNRSCGCADDGAVHAGARADGGSAPREGGQPVRAAHRLHV